MTVVRISDPSLLPSLHAHLESRIDCIATALSADTLEATLLGSYHSEAMEMEMELRIRAWEEAQRARGVTVRVEFE